MTRVYTHEIQNLEDGELYTANIWENGSEWSGLLQEFPEVKCREKTKEALVQTLEVRLLEALAAHADAWDKQLEADVDAGKFDAIAERVIADFDAGKCKDVASFLAQYSSNVLESVGQFSKPALMEIPASVEDGGISDTDRILESCIWRNRGDACLALPGIREA